jgi:hypothetical protein
MKPNIFGGVYIHTYIYIYIYVYIYIEVYTLYIYTHMFTVFLAWFFESILGTMIPKKHMPYTVVSKPTWGANHPSQICLPSKLSQKASAKPRIYLFLNYGFFSIDFHVLLSTMFQLPDLLISGGTYTWPVFVGLSLSSTWKFDHFREADD